VRAQIRMHMANLRSERELSEEGSKEKTSDPPKRAASAEETQQGAVDWPNEIASLPSLDVTESSRSVRAVQKTAQPARASVRRAWQVAAALAGALGLVLALAWVRPSVGRSDVSDAQPSASAESSPSAAVSSASSVPPDPSAPPMAPVHVDVRASPPEALITLDDAPLTNPFSGSFSRDALQHRLQVARDGFVPEGRLLRFDGDDVALAIDLARAHDAGSSDSRSRGASPRGAPARPQLDKDPYQ
jgi:hypothetical protein